MAKHLCLVFSLLSCAVWAVQGSTKTDRAVSRRLLTGDSAQITSAGGRKLAQTANLAQGVYHIQSSSRLQTCWNYLSVPNCTIGDTADLYYQDDGSGRQQFNLVPLSGSNLYYLEVNNGRGGCATWLSGQPCPENRIGAAYSDDTSGRQQWYIKPLGDNLFTISLPRGRESCDTILSASCCGANSTSFVSVDTGSGAEHWLITPISSNAPSSSPPPPAALESQVFAASTESASTTTSSPPPPPPPPPPSGASTESASEPPPPPSPSSSGTPPPPPPPPPSSSGNPLPPPPPSPTPSGASSESVSEPPPPSTGATTASGSPPPPSLESTVFATATQSSPPSVTADSPPPPMSEQSPPPPAEQTPAATTSASIESSGFPTTSQPSPPPPPQAGSSLPPPAEQSPPPPAEQTPAATSAATTAASIESSVFPTTSQSSPPPPPQAESPPPPPSAEQIPAPTAAAQSAATSTSGCSGKKGVVYDFFFQYCDSVLVTNSDWFLNFDSGTGCTDPAVIAKHQPMIWGTDRIQSGYAAITSRPSYAKPSYVLTFNEPNYAFGGGTPTNVVDPVTAANLWPQLIAQYDPLGIQLIAPSAIDCAGDGNCKNTGTAVGWLTTFRDTLNANTPGAWDAIHALNHHTYVTDFATIQSDLTNLYQQFGKPIWVTEIASGSGSSMEQNVALMNQFVPWANSQSWIERYFWNQATPAEGVDANIQNSYLVNKDANGSGDGSLSVLGQTYANFPC